jgi:hypothetical protein
MRWAPATACICLFALIACNANRNVAPRAETELATTSDETEVYRAFIRNHFEDDWKTSCPHAVLDTTPVEPENKNPAQWFNLESVKPSSTLIEQFLTIEQDQHPLTTWRNSFFIPVDDAVLKTMFSESCSVEDMQQLKCGWLQFKQLYGQSCGHWHFSHIAFN